MSIELSLEQIGTVSPDAVEAWLRSRGWRVDGEVGPSGRFMCKTIGKSVESVLLATKTNAPRYASAMGLLIEQVADAEVISRENLLRDLTMAAYDVIRIRLVDADEGVVELDNAIKVVRESRAALVAAANAAAAKAPRKNYAGRMHEVVAGYAERVQLGQTERGSFIVPLLCPHSYDSEERPVLPTLWFGRRVTRKFASALSAIDEALGFGGGKEAMDAFASSTARGVSANMCAALGRLVEAGGRVEVGIRWALAEQEDYVPKPVQLHSSSAALLLKAAGHLAEADPPPSEPVVGFVTKLHQPDRAVVNAVIEGTWKNVHIDLPEEFRTLFSRAWEARTPLLIEGELGTDGKRIIMRALAGASPVEEPDESA